ncbi:unnamed protein product [Notodromas monacha]|uniref:AP complex subunit beta n=1 Tax=Notodromas monacha TaxID=399045 RepID=A0A7R9BIV9_9CRUS|nr:unnamed protein product [Notodromas monacha]CAG0916030.1 unnamed protein product [Notodromas monacha]
MTDSKYFSTTKKGEIFELKGELNSDKKEKKKEAVKKLLTALNECTEWGQVFILDALTNYNPRDDKEAQSICERVTPRLAHANAAVVLSAIKVLMRLVETTNMDSEFVATLLKKLSPPLVTLLSSEPEVQYVALRNINLIVQRRPDILKNEMKVFFVKYNDPIYVKLEKLDIMIRLANGSNIAQVLAELKEYATEVDVDFVRKSVRAIGRCAIKVETSAEKCVATLLDLIQTKVNYVVQEAVVVIKDIFRKYPNKYESIISTLCENLDTLDEPEARASMIWIIGEYAERINNADELLESFLSSFSDENAQVQLQLLTAIVKLFLKKPADTQELVQQVLSLATQDSDNPDLRDRGFIYWRLLSTDPAAAREVVLAEKPLISEETDKLEPTLLDELVVHLASLASVYHKPPSAFVEGAQLNRVVGSRRSTPATSSGGSGEPTAPVSTVIPNQDSLIGDLLGLDLGAPMSGVAEPAPNAPVDIFGGGLDSLMGGDAFGAPAGPPAPAPSGLAGFGVPVASASGLLGDVFGTPAVPTAYVPPKQVWVPAAKGKGLEVSGTFARRRGEVVMELTLTNRAMQPMSGFAIQFNKNSFGLLPAAPLVMNAPLLPNSVQEVSLPLSAGAGPVMKMDPINNLQDFSLKLTSAFRIKCFDALLRFSQVALKNNVDVFYFAALVPMHVYLTEDGQMDRKVFLATWKDIPASAEVQVTIPDFNLTPDGVSAKLQENNIFTIAKWTVEGQDLLYQSGKFPNGIWVLAELKIKPGTSEAILSLKSRAADVIPGVQQIYELLMKRVSREESPGPEPPPNVKRTKVILPKGVTMEDPSIRSALEKLMAANPDANVVRVVKVTKTVDALPKSGVKDDLSALSRAMATQTLDDLRKQHERLLILNDQLRKKCEIAEERAESVLKRVGPYASESSAAYVGAGGGTKTAKTAETIMAKCARYMTPVVANFFACQFRNNTRTEGSRRWLDNDFLFAFTIYLQSPHAYLYLSKVVALPPLESLNRWLDKVEVKPGVQLDLKMFENSILGCLASKSGDFSCQEMQKIADPNHLVFLEQPKSMKLQNSVSLEDEDVGEEMEEVEEDQEEEDIKESLPEDQEEDQHHIVGQSLEYYADSSEPSADATEFVIQAEDEHAVEEIIGDNEEEEVGEEDEEHRDGDLESYDALAAAVADITSSL